MNEIAVIDRSKATLVEIRTDNKNFPRLHKYSQERATHEMSKAILLVFQLRGKQITKEELTQMSATLVNILLDDDYGIGTRNITFEEITRVFKKTALGQGGELYGVNVSTLYQAIVDYCENEGQEANAKAKKIYLDNHSRNLNGLGVVEMAKNYANKMVENGYKKNEASTGDITRDTAISQSPPSRAKERDTQPVL